MTKKRHVADWDKSIVVVAVRDVDGNDGRVLAQRLSIPKYYTQVDMAFNFLYHGVFCYLAIYEFDELFPCLDVWMDTNWNGFG